MFVDCRVRDENEKRNSKWANARAGSLLWSRRVGGDVNGAMSTSTRQGGTCRQSKVESKQRACHGLGCNATMLVDGALEMHPS